MSRSFLKQHSKNNIDSFLKNLTYQNNTTIFGKTFHYYPKKKKNNKHSLFKNLTNQNNTTIFGKTCF